MMDRSIDLRNRRLAGIVKEPKANTFHQEMFGFLFIGCHIGNL
jgi:hypothetical protein